MGPELLQIKLHEAENKKGIKQMPTFSGSLPLASLNR
jgi:hypothetical protein